MVRTDLRLSKAPLECGSPLPLSGAAPKAPEDWRTPKGTPYAVVVATPRTGSTLLCEALAQHPAVLGFGEIFLHEEEGRRAYHEAGCGDAEYYNGGAPGEYLARLAAVAGARGRELVTFKLMDYQEPAAWAWLARQRRVPVIHLRRADALAAAASALAGEQSGLWHARSAEDVARAAEVRVALSRAQLAEWRARQRTLARRVRAWRRPVLALEYAELAADFSATLARVFAFLGLPPHAVAPTQCKLHARPLAEWVELLECASPLAL